MVYSTRRFVLCHTLCFLLVAFSPFNIVITSLGEERELISVLFVRLFDLRLFGLVCFLFLLCLGRAASCDCATLWTFLLPFFLFVSGHITFASFMISLWQLLRQN